MQVSSTVETNAVKEHDWNNESSEESDAEPEQKMSGILRELFEDDEVVDISLLDRVLTTTGVVAFLVHMTMTQTALSLMTCTEIRPAAEQIDDSGDGFSSDASTHGNSTSGDGGFADAPSSYSSESCRAVPAESQGYRLLDDLELCCADTTTQSYMFGLGVPALLLYTFGIPLLTGAVLAIHKGRLTDPRVATTFGFMRAGYRDDAFWFECVVMLRKAVLVVIAVGMAPLGVEVQTYAVLSLLFGVAVLQSVLQPFAGSLRNRLELFGLCAAFLTFDAGLFLGSGEVGSTSKQVVNVMVFFLNVLFVLASLSVVMGSKLGMCTSKEMIRQSEVIDAEYNAA